MLVGAYDRAIDEVEDPVELSGAISLLLEGVQHPLEEADLAPAVEATGHSAPGAIALREVPPRTPVRRTYKILLRIVR
jgi:hypothetical protein